MLRKIGLPVVIDGAYVSNYCASQDLNECVTALSKEFDISEQRKHRRQRISKKSMAYKVLISEFEKNANWSYQKSMELADRLGLTRRQGYLWNHA